MANDFSPGQQTFRVAYLGFSFMIIFTAYNSLQNIVSKLYEDYHFQNLGQTAILVLYFFFGLCTFFTSYIIKLLGYKKAMFIASLGYAIFEATGLLIAAETSIPHPLIWIIVLVGASLCGISASVIWVAQGAYVNQVASADRKSSLFGLFWGIMMSSQIFGNLLTTFVLGKMTNFIYFLILTLLGFSSAFLFMFLPSVSKKVQQTEKITLKEQIQKVIVIIKDKKYRYLNIYFLFPGLCVAFYAAFLYKLIVLSIKQNEGELDDDFNKRVKFSAGLVFIALGASQLFMGIMMNLFSEKFCKFKLAIVGTLLVECAGFVSFICYFLQSYPLCFITAFLWGSAETFIQTNIGAMISHVFPGRVQAFSAYRVIFAIGVVTTIALSILLSKVPAYVFLTLIIIAQILQTGVSFNLIQLKQLGIGSELKSKDKQANNKESLLSNSAKDELNQQV